jgi:hypothetical protein
VFILKKLNSAPIKKLLFLFFFKKKSSKNFKTIIKKMYQIVSCIALLSGLSYSFPQQQLGTAGGLVGELGGTAQQAPSVDYGKQTGSSVSLSANPTETTYSKQKGSSVTLSQVTAPTGLTGTVGTSGNVGNSKFCFLTI